LNSEHTPFELDTKVDSARSTVIVSISGEVDLSVVDTFNEELEASLSGEAVLIDMQDVTFMDSSALHVLLRAKQKLDSSGVPSALVVGDGSVVARLFELTGLEESLPHFGTIDEARSALD
jgi:anti-anti-sigma factor